MNRKFFVKLDHLSLHVQNIVVNEEMSTHHLIFLHDALGSIPQWKEFPDLVCSKVGMNGIVYERQGHGHSSPLSKQRDKRYLHEQAWDILPVLLRELNIQNPILIGHSDGGSIALIFGAQYVTSSIITIAAHIFVENITLEGIRNTVLKEVALLEKLEKYHGDNTGPLYNAWHQTWLSDEFRNWSIEDEIQQISAPVLAIQGEKDIYGTMKQVEGILFATKGYSQKFILPDAGHLPFREQPELIADKIAAFITGNIS